MKRRGVWLPIGAASPGDRIVNVFDLDRALLGDYERFARSFTQIRAPVIHRQVEEIYASDRFWPEPLISINPHFEVAAEFADEIAGAVMIDPPVFAPQNPRTPPPPRPARARRVDPSLSAVVARFRLIPPQPCANLFILDFIARRSAAETVDAEGRPGFALSFDPGFFEKSKRIDPAPMLKAAGAPLAVVRGERSRLFGAPDAAYLMSLIPPGSPYVEIPEAEHHVMIDQPLAFVAALRALLAAWP